MTMKELLVSVLHLVVYDVKMGIRTYSYHCQP